MVRPIRRRRGRCAEAAPTSSGGVAMRLSVYTPPCGASPAAEAGDRRVWFAQALRGVACLMVVVAHCAIVFVQHPTVAAAMGMFPPLTDLPQPAYLRLFQILDGYRVPMGL